ncbi:MAG: hypothetical protein RMI56_03220 [Sulfolobales archaeon]|nr:hypothetical protein [Sulfolobales archaeon]MDW8082791.1 hypothetical protein [Sulfolobales archaeon]
MIKLEKFAGNPILRPDPSKRFMEFATFNSAALTLDGKVYTLFRAQTYDFESTIGLAISADGTSLEYVSEEPIYRPREIFEKRVAYGIGPVGCEDPRVTVLDSRMYMLYTAVSDAYDYVRVALTSIDIADFLEGRWDRWSRPILISPPGVWDKNAALLPRRVRGKYVVFHRFFPNIWVDFVDSLDFRGYWLRGFEFLRVRLNMWDSDKVGIAGVPVEVSEGWVAIYHARSAYDGAYRLGAVLLDREDPTSVISRLDQPILEPTEWYETEGISVVFSCGHVVLDGKLFVYYGASDKYLAVAYIDLDELVGELLKYSDP